VSGTWAGARGAQPGKGRVGIEAYLVVGFFLVAFILGAVLIDKVVFLGLLAALFFALLVVRPELALAVQYNGTLIYFYTLFRLGMEPKRIMTGGFFAFLNAAYLLGGLLLLLRYRKVPRFGPIDYLVITLLLLVFLSFYLFYAGNPAAYVKITFTPFLVVAPYLGTKLLVREDHIRRFWDYAMLVPGLLLAPFLYEFIFHVEFGDIGRVSPFSFEKAGSNSPLVGHAYAVFILVGAMKLLETKGRHRTLLLALLPVAAYVSFVSGGRAAIIGLAVAVLVYTLFLTTVRLRYKALVVIAAAGTIVAAQQFLPSAVVQFYQESLNYQSESAASLVARVDLYSLAWSDFIENPLFGVGVGNSCGGEGYPHNAILEVAAEMGVIGLTVYAALVATTLGTAVRFIRQRGGGDDPRVPLMKMTLVLFVFSFTVSMFSGMLTIDQTLFTSIGMVGGLASIGGRRTEGALPATG